MKHVVLGAFEGCVEEVFPLFFSVGLRGNSCDVRGGHDGGNSTEDPP